jgi:hypothetical protein
MSGRVGCVSSRYSQIAWLSVSVRPVDLEHGHLAGGLRRRKSARVPSSVLVDEFGVDLLFRKHQPDLAAERGERE